MGLGSLSMLPGIYTKANELMGKLMGMALIYILMVRNILGIERRIGRMVLGMKYGWMGLIIKVFIVMGKDRG